MQRYLIIGVLAALAVAVPLVARQPSAAELFNRGLLLERAEGKVAEAIVLYERIVADYPNDRATLPQALYRLGLAYESRRDARASAAFARLIKDFSATRYALEARQRLLQAQTPPFRSRDISGQLTADVASPAVFYSQDGRQAAYLRRTTFPAFGVYVRDLSNGREQVLGEWKGLPIVTAQFSPDGRRLAAMRGRGGPQASFDPMLRVFDTTGGGRHADIALSPIVYAGSPSVGQMPWSPDGRSIAYLAPATDPKRATVQIWSAATATSRSLGIEVDAHTPIRWSPDGKRIVLRVQLAAKNIEEVRVVTVATGASQVVAGAGYITEGRWTLNDQLVLRRRSAGTSSVTDVFMLPASGGTPMKVCAALTGEQCWVSPSGRYVIRRSAADEKHYYRELPDGTERPLTHNAGEETGLRLSADGRLAAFFSNRDSRWAAYVMALDDVPVGNPVKIATLDGVPTERDNSLEFAGHDVVLRSLVLTTDIFRLSLDPKTATAMPGASWQRLTQSAPINARPVISPDSASIVYAYQDGEKRGIAIMTAAGARERRLTESPDHTPGLMAWRSSSELLHATGRGNGRGVSVLNPGTGVSTLVRSAPVNGIDYITGRDEVLAGASEPGNPPTPIFKAISLSSGAERVIRPGTRAGDDLDLWFVSPDGKRIAYTVLRGDDTELRVMNTDGTGDRALIPMQKAEIGLAAWSGDSRFLLYDPDYRGQRVSVIDAETGQSRALGSLTFEWNGGASWAPDGSFIVLTNTDFRRVFTRIEGVTYGAVAKLMRQ